MTEPQIIYDMPEEQYHAETGIGPGKWVTRSILRDYCESPSACKLRMDGNPFCQRGSNRGMDFGRLFEARFCGMDIRVVAPICNPKTGRPYGRDTKTYDEWLTAEGIDPRVDIVADQYDIDKADFLVSRLVNAPGGRGAEIHDLCARGLARNQVTLRWTEEGVPCQARVDILFTDGPRGWMVDLKTTAKPLAKFTGTAEEYGYDLQDVHYSAGAAANGLRIVTGGVMWFAVVETSYPYRARVARLPDELRLYAIERRRDALRNIAGDYWQDHDDTNEAGLYVPDMLAWISCKYGSEEDLRDE